MTRQQAGVSAQQLRDVMRAEPAELNYWQDKAERLNAVLLATAPPEQADSLEQPDHYDNVQPPISTTIGVIPCSTHTETAKPIPGMTAYIPEQQPQAASAGALSGPDGYAFLYPDGIRFTAGEPINGSRPLDSIPYYFESSLAARDQKVRAEVLTEAAKYYCQCEELMGKNCWIHQQLAALAARPAPAASKPEATTKEQP